MTVQEFREALSFLGWDQATLWRRLGRTEKQVSLWANGQSGIPEYAARYLSDMIEVKRMHHRVFRQEDV